MLATLRAKGLFLNNLYNLTCLFVHTLRCGNSYITLLCAYFHALVMNENPSQYCTVYFITGPKNQITLPVEVIKKLNLRKDDSIEVDVNENGQIILTPVMIAEKKIIADIKEAFDDVENGRVSDAMSAYEIIKKLGL